MMIDEMLVIIYFIQCCTPSQDPFLICSQLGSNDVRVAELHSVFVIDLLTVPQESQ